MPVRGRASRARRVAAGSLLLLLGAAAAWGTPDETSPKGYIEMPQAEDGAWVLTAPPGSGRNWGTPVFVRYLAMVAREWKRRHPDGPVMRIGDMSKPDGSNFPPHKTHKDGLTADIFTRPKNICHVRYPDQQLTLEFAQLMFDYGARQILYNGELVTREIGVARKWPKHDDHFHVVIDPSRVPAEGALLVLPARPVRDGSWVAGQDLEEDRTGLKLSWDVLGRARLKRARILFDDLDDANGLLHDSGPQRLPSASYRLPVALEDGQRYRWRVELTDRNDETVGFGWQGLRTDLSPPTVETLAPKDDAVFDAAPTLSWRYRKQGSPQAGYRIELDRDPSHRKLWKTLGPVDGTATRHPLNTVPLKRSKRYHWRVVCRDAHGNEGASAWQTFKTSSAFGKIERTPDGKPVRKGVVTARGLNLRSGPGTSHPVQATLAQDTRVRILAESGGWLEVEAAGARGPVRGFVSAKYVRIDP